MATHRRCALGTRVGVCLFFCLNAVLLLRLFGLHPSEIGEPRLIDVTGVQAKGCQNNKRPNLPLRFSQFGTFRIAQFADLHWGEGDLDDIKTRAVQFAIINAERPDFVVLSGDQLDAAASYDIKRAIHNVVLPMEVKGVPYASILGNHDADTRTGSSKSILQRQKIIEAEQECDMSLTQLGPRNIGAGNYILPVYDAEGQIHLMNLIFMDSGPSLHGYIGDAHLQWLEEQLQHQQVPSVLFVHSPLPEHLTVCDVSPCWGWKYEKFEGQDAGSARLFPLLAKHRVMAVFSGHDHKNDYCGELQGVLLCYGRVTGVRGYGDPRLIKRGGRIVEIFSRRDKADIAIATWIRLGDGRIVHDVPRRPAGLPGKARAWLDMGYALLYGALWGS